MNIIKTERAITLAFDEAEISVLADSLVDPLGHFELVAREKVANCKQRIFREWQDRFITGKQVATIPTDEVELLKLILAQPDYKNRADRDKADLSLRMAG